MKQAGHRDMFKKASKSVCQPFWYLLTPLSPNSINFSAMNIPENKDEDPNDPEPADEKVIQMEYSSDALYSPSIEAVTKYYL